MGAAAGDDDGAASCCSTPANAPEQAAAKKDGPAAWWSNDRLPPNRSGQKCTGQTLLHRLNVYASTFQPHRSGNSMEVGACMLGKVFGKPDTT